MIGYEVCEIRWACVFAQVSECNVCEPRRTSSHPFVIVISQSEVQAKESVWRRFERQFPGRTLKLENILIWMDYLNPEAASKRIYFQIIFLLTPILLLILTCSTMRSYTIEEYCNILSIFGCVCDAFWKYTGKNRHWKTVTVTWSGFPLGFHSWWFVKGK